MKTIKKIVLISTITLLTIIVSIVIIDYQYILIDSKILLNHFILGKKLNSQVSRGIIGDDAWLTIANFYLADYKDQMIGNSGDYIRIARLIYLLPWRFEVIDSYAGARINEQDFPVGVNGQLMTSEEFAQLAKIHRGEEINIRFIGHIPEGFNSNFPIDPLTEPERAKTFDYLIGLAQKYNKPLREFDEILDKRFFGSIRIKSDFVLPTTNYEFSK